jgi:hypothetical protein
MRDGQTGGRVATAQAVRLSAIAPGAELLHAGAAPSPRRFASASAYHRPEGGPPTCKSGAIAAIGAATSITPSPRGAA